MPKLVIYTAAFGDHDQPVDLPGLSGVADVCCFTDNADLIEKLPSAHVFVRRGMFRTSRMDAKWYKMSARHLFPEHEWSIYLDASVRVKQPHQMVSAVRAALDQKGSEGLAFFSHPEDPLRSLEDEALFSMTFPKYAGEPCVDQVLHYRHAGMSSLDSDYRLYAGGVIGRMHWEMTERFEKAWFDECVHWSVQDQLSLPYVLWRQRRMPGVIPGSIYDNEFLCRVWSGPGE